MILRARIVVPVSRPPVEDGVVCVAGDRIVWVGRSAELPAAHQQGERIDLGEVILLPGLINAHCHLDYTRMAGLIPPPKSFTDWITSMVALKAAWSLEDFDGSWREGAAMLLRTGTTTVADIEAVPELLPAAWESTPLRVLSFRELIHLKDRQSAADLVERAVNGWLDLPHGEGRLGLSPHAPYTTSAPLLEMAARAAHRRKWRLTTHVSESEQEFEMFMYRQGAMYAWLKGQRDMSDCGRGSPVQHLERCGYLDDNLLAVHVNYLWRHDASILANHRVSVAHCPRSHDYFRHLRFAREELESAGVNICLGTDSLATVCKEAKQPIELSLFAEMQMLAVKAPGLAPEKILRMVTINGAVALGSKGQIGELSENALADLIALPFTGQAVDALEAVVQHQGAVAGSMIGGQWAIHPPAGKSG
jgi:cytosine/adenosine deaminase-related metal-dependent hydrolase